MLHEKLVCYQQSVEIAEVLGKEVASWPRGYGFLSDQLKRAMASVVLNIAEGNARRSINERRRFFQISLGSISEVAACLDLAKVFSLLSSSTQIELKEQLRASYCKIRKLP